MKSMPTLIGSLLMPLAFNVTAHVVDASYTPKHLLWQAKQPTIGLAGC